VIDRLHVQVLPGHHCIVALGKLLYASVTKQYNLVLVKGGQSDLCLGK